MSKRIDEIRGRLRYRRHLPIYTPSMAARWLDEIDSRIEREVKGGNHGA